MLICKSPFRLSLYGGGCDYKSFYSQHGCLLIGSTINKYSYLTVRRRPTILTKENSFSYSKLEIVKSTKEFENPLIKAILEHCNLDCCVDFHHLTDIPHRTGLGGSSSFAVGLLYLIKKLRNEPIDRIKLAKEAIYIEREVLKEAGGVQDQIWAAACNGPSSIEINQNGDFAVKPLPITEEFKKTFEDSLVLIYTNEQRKSDESAKSYDGKEKSKIHQIAIAAYRAFLDEDIKQIGSLLYESWLSKKTISNSISNSNVDGIVEDLMNRGCWGTKLIGSGQGGFLCAVCDPITKKKVIEKYKNSILDIKFDKEGVKEIYRGDNL